MKVLVASDIHGTKKGVETVARLSTQHKVDLIVVCGDITHFGPAYHAKDMLDNFEAPTFAIPGNCDPPETVTAIEESKAETLHRRCVKFKGEHFVGLGGAPQSPHGLPMEFSEERIFNFLDEIMERRAILVTHCPPKGRNDYTRGTHLGSSAIADIVEKWRPKLVLSGHIHEARGVVKEEHTVFVNPGPAKNGFAALIHLGKFGVSVKLLGKE
jgi:putative phosphoesterase